ncbi:hypothetical protein OROMI_030151 [Orobanche minor]
MPSQEILKIRDVARILVFKIRPSQEILKIRDEILKIRDVAISRNSKNRDITPLEAKGILTYRKRPRNRSVWHFSSKLDVPSNVVQKKIVAQILVFKIRPSQEILKIRDGTPLEPVEILTYRKKPSKWIVAISRNSKNRDITPLEAKGILTYRKRPRNRSVWHFSSKLDVPSNVVQKKIVAQILVFKIRPSQEILKIRDGTPLEPEEILTYRKKPSKWIDKLDVPSNVVQKKIVARILVFKIRPSQEILKIRDGTPMEPEEILTYRKKPSKLIVARILVFKIRPSHEILKIHDGTPLEAKGILTYIKRPRNRSVWHFSSKLDVPSNVVQKKRVARILVFKIRPSQEILKIRDGTPLEPEEILTYRKKPSKWIVARILVFKIRPSQEILKIRDDAISRNSKNSPSHEILKIHDGTPLEAKGILTYIKRPRNRSVWHFSSKLDVPSNVVQKKRVARILVFKIRPSQEILKIRDGTPLEPEEILTYRKKPSKWIGLALF